LLKQLLVGFGLVTLIERITEELVTEPTTQEGNNKESNHYEYLPKRPSNTIISIWHGWWLLGIDTIVHSRA
jgi:hypothetical protein